MQLNIVVTSDTSSITSCSPKKLSKLKLVKARLRNTMGESQLEDLIPITCESVIEINIEIRHWY